MFVNAIDSIEMDQVSCLQQPKQVLLASVSHWIVRQVLFEICEITVICFRCITCDTDNLKPNTSFYWQTLNTS